MGNTSSFHIGDAYNHSDKFKLKKGVLKWTLHLVDDVKYDRVLSAFQYDTSNFELLNNCEMYLKTLRHPGVPRYVQRYEDVESGRRLVVVDRVTPLEAVIDIIGSLEVISGIRDLLDVMIFFHDTAKVFHNNICIQNIVVDQNGSWQFAGFDQMSKVQKGNTDITQLLQVILILFENISDLGDSVQIFRERISAALDNGCSNTTTDLLTSRSPLTAFIEDPLFNNDFIEISLFLQNFTLKSQEQKQIFFNELPKKLYDLPEAVVASRLLRHLLSRIILLESASDEFLLPHLLTPYHDKRCDTFSSDGGSVTPLLGVTLFTRHVLPLLFRIFHVRNAHIRLVVLHHLPRFVHLFPVQTLKDFILPQVLSGLICDDNDELVSETLQSLALLVPILGGSVVLGTQSLVNKSKIDNNRFSNCRKKDTSIRTNNRKNSLRSKHSSSSSLKNSSKSLKEMNKSLKSLKVASSKPPRDSTKAGASIPPSSPVTSPPHPECRTSVDPNVSLDGDLDTTPHNVNENVPEEIIVCDDDWEDWTTTDDVDLSNEATVTAPITTPVLVLDHHQHYQHSPSSERKSDHPPVLDSNLAHNTSLGYEFEINVNKKMPDLSSSGLLIDDMFAEMVPSSCKNTKTRDNLLSLLNASVATNASSNMFDISNENTEDNEQSAWQDDWGDI